MSFGDNPSKSAQRTFALVAVCCVLGVAVLLSYLGTPDWVTLALALFTVGAISLAIGRLAGLQLAFAGGIALMLFGVTPVIVHLWPWLSHGWVPTILLSSMVVVLTAAIGGYAWRARRRQPPGARDTGEAAGCMVPLVAVLVILIGPCLVALAIPGDSSWYDGYTEGIAAVVAVVFIFLVQIRDRNPAGRLPRLAVGLPAVLLIAGGVGLFLAAVLG